MVRRPKNDGVAGTALQTDHVANHLVPALFVLVATALQMFLSLREVATSRADALKRKRAEDELVAELPRAERAAARRDFVRDRDSRTNREIREAWAHVLAWALLFGASVTAVFNVVLDK